MFDDLTPKPENDSVESETKPETESSLGSAGNVPSNLSPNPSPSLSQEGVSTSIDKNLKPASSEEFDQRIQKLEAKGKKRGIRFSRIGLLVGAVIALAMMGIGYYLLTQVIGISEQTQLSVENIPNIGRDNQREPAGEKIDEPKKISITDEMRACEVDDDCIQVVDGCCLCDQGGEQTAINKNYDDAWKTEQNEYCDKVECNGESTCVEGSVSCQDMMCVFSPKEAGCFIEGESFLISDRGEKECCDDLQELSPRIDLVGGECKNIPDESICINCGDGICGLGENYCNCPADCEKGMGLENATSSDETSDLIDETGLDGCVGDNCEMPDDAIDNLDTDADGLIDIEEIRLGTDINNFDTDGDGLSDGDEIVYGTNPLNPDTDGDSYLDGSEVANGYNPLGDGMLN